MTGTNAILLYSTANQRGDTLRAILFACVGQRSSFCFHSDPKDVTGEPLFSHVPEWGRSGTEADILNQASIYEHVTLLMLALLELSSCIQEQIPFLCFQKG